MTNQFLAGIIVGNLTGFLIATLCHLASEVSDREIETEIEKEEEDKNE
jgi:hypothetical protein